MSEGKGRESKGREGKGSHNKLVADRQTLDTGREREQMNDETPKVAGVLAGCSVGYAAAAADASHEQQWAKRRKRIECRERKQLGAGLER